MSLFLVFVVVVSNELNAANIKRGLEKKKKKALKQL